MSLTSTAASAVAEVGAVLDRAIPQQVERMAAPPVAANRIAVYGVGREGLMIKSLTMRLFHLGMDVHVVGDMTTPPWARAICWLSVRGRGSFLRSRR